jgi:hypothetical protein
MKLTTGIVAMAMMVGGLWAQNPNIIDKTRSTMNSVQEQKTNDSNAALAGVGVPQTAKPVAGPPATKPAPAAALKPANAPVAKPAPAAVTPAKVVVKATAAPAPKAKPVAEKVAAPLATASSTAKPQAAAPKPAVAAKAVPKIAAKEPVQAPKQQAAKDVKPAAPVLASGKPAADASKKGDAAKQPKLEDKKWAMTGKRDPFFSPVVQQAGGSGCSSGKKCLEIGQINLRGVVKSDNGFIAVVTNNMNKAYFLRENDPVFNGYVVKITGDSVVFQETLQDKLGKSFTREIVKRIFTPAV